MLLKSSILPLFLLLSTALLAQAYTNLKASVNVRYSKEVQASTLFKELTKQTNYRFFFDQSVGDVVLSHALYEKKSLGQVLTNLNQQGFDFQVRDQGIAVKYNKIATANANHSVNSSQQQRPGRIGGKVFGNRGETLSGATIRVLQQNQVRQSSVDGSFSFSLAPGTYTVEISYIAFQTKRITDVEVKAGQYTGIDVLLMPSTKTLEGVVVTGTYKRESTAGLYQQQKNATSITDGISAEQIAKTPDINIGQVLKRVSGVVTVDNKYVVVRGLSDRYNQAMIDNITLPSTNMNRRSFAFDVVPQELVSNVVVNKTATPDRSADFSGGQISVNTMDMPLENFTNFSIGSGANTLATGKDFFMLGEQHASDYFGLSNKIRKEPAGLQSWIWPNLVNLPPLGPDGDYPPDFPKDLLLAGSGSKPYQSLDAIAQSRLFNANELNVSRYKAAPFQNARFSLGRIYQLNSDLRFGFVAGATYRNQQTLVKFNNVRGNYSATGGPNYMDSVENGPGRSYRFNSTVGSVVNLALQGTTFKVALKNMYSRVFDNNFNETYRKMYGRSTEVKNRELFQDPQFTWVRQHKLEGENLLGNSGLKFEYSAGATRIGQEVQDQRRLVYERTLTVGGVEYYQTPNIRRFGILDTKADYRMWTHVKETDYSWTAALSKDFKLGSHIQNTAKIGYNGWAKHRVLHVTRALPYTTTPNNMDNKIEGIYSDLLSPEKIGAKSGQAFYYLENTNGGVFNGTMQTHSPYVMLDQRFFDKLRLVYGLRLEHYNLANRQKEYIEKRYNGIPDYFKNFTTTGESDWRALPSLNLTYSLTPKMNIRAAYGKTAIRPDFRETSYFGFYDVDLDATIIGRQVVSTIVHNVDLRYEFYPAPGEIISVSGYFKHMKNPIELVWEDDATYRFQNQFLARNYGLELEFRKSLGFIADRAWLRNLSLFGNGSLLKSGVETQSIPLRGVENVEQTRTPYANRPLFGQSPWIVNAGITYQDPIFGFTASYNRSGPRSNTVHQDFSLVEYENGRNMLDLQLSARVLKRKGEIKFNAANLLDEYLIYYTNDNDYEMIMDGVQMAGYKLKKGHSINFEPSKGDRIRYRSKTGSNFSIAFSYYF